jgi:hypothetical protein
LNLPPLVFGSLSSFRAISSADLFLAPFLLLADPVVIMSPIFKLQVKVLSWGGPVSLTCSHSIRSPLCIIEKSKAFELFRK